ncbi:FadR/GntR family transcriptional regulator [Sporomusa sp. KB1]|jgi:DNA-binding FadR family transcriptional regulator|uniref:FadR/GntR family transcriptional regulator n=1 Tax=Sporomusa sp. KB1 TaxID=943346 RepID=UPI0011A88CE2|nr:FadR/GntR family transcriptional regulator [Sporomusa sp. KB1]TWH51974.1 DNA-binding FadR family transcriptional regulator [Sporomusa sp. KB1]
MEEKKTIAQQIAVELSKQINDEKYSLGEKLPTERDLVDEFNVSRNTVREAIKILATKGIVTVKHGSGIYVHDSKLNNVSDFDSLKEHSLELDSIYEFRMICEPEIARLAAIRATPEEIQQILKCAEEIVKLVNSDELFYKKDEEFHCLIANASHNNVFITLSPLIMSFVITGILISNANGGAQISKNNAREGHLAIAKFIEARDEIGAYSAMRMHLGINQKFIREVINLK